MGSATRALVPVEGVSAPGDFLVRTARFFFYAASLTMPALIARAIGDQLTFSDVLFVLAAGFMTASVGRPQRHPNQAMRVALFLILAGGLLATYRADLPVTSLLVVARMVFLLGVLTWTARVVLDTAGRVRRATLLMVIGCVIFGLTSVAQSRFGNAVAAIDVGPGRLPGLAAHVTDAGGMLALSVPILLGYLFIGRRRLLVLASLGVVVIGLILSGSISGMASALIGVLVILLRMRVRLFSILGGMAVTAAALAASLRLQGDRASNLNPLARLSASTSGSYDTAASRLETYRTALAHIASDPFIGRGLDSQSGVVFQGLTTHNMVLLAWFQGGLLFVAGLLVALTAAAHAAFGRVTADRNLQIQLSGAAVAEVAFSMTSPLLYQRYLWLPVILVLSLQAVRPPAAAR